MCYAIGLVRLNLFAILSKHVRISYCLLIASLLSQPSIAQDLVNKAKLPANNAPAISLIPSSTLEIAPQAAVQPKANSRSIESTENTTLTALKQMTEAEKLAMQAKAIAHLKSVLGEKRETTQAKKVTPYEQLVKLAFKGKGVNGINSYQDAARQFCQQAKENDDAESLFALGWMYENGKGFDKDENIAAFFYHKAAAQNNYRAKRALIGFKGDEKLATIPTCMLADPPAEPLRAVFELAPAGSNGNAFYDRGPIFEIVDRLAPRYHIETDLAMAFIKVESNFNPRATSPKNAQGLMQLIPATSKRFNVRNPYNPEDNIKGGLAYLQWLMAYYEGDVRLVAAAYNAGEGAVDRYKGIPPYRETKNYVRKIYRLYRKSFHPFRQDLLIGERSDIIQVSSKH